MEKAAYAEKADEELAYLAENGTDVFGEIIERYEPKLRRYIHRLGNLTKEDADDLLQEIFIKVYKNINSFSKEMKFSSWIYRIAHNETISHFRKVSVRPEGHYADIDEEILANIIKDDSATIDIGNFDSKDVLLSALDSLPEKYRELLVLRFMEEKSYEEISDILKSPPGSVAVGIKRAKEKLKEILVEKGYNYGN